MRVPRAGVCDRPAGCPRDHPPRAASPGCSTQQQGGAARRGRCCCLGRRQDDLALPPTAETRTTSRAACSAITCRPRPNTHPPINPSTHLPGRASGPARLWVRGWAAGRRQAAARGGGDVGSVEGVRLRKPRPPFTHSPWCWTWVQHGTGPSCLPAAPAPLRLGRRRHAARLRDSRARSRSQPARSLAACPRTAPHALARSLTSSRGSWAGRQAAALARRGWERASSHRTGPCCRSGGCDCTAGSPARDRAAERRGCAQARFEHRAH